MRLESRINPTFLTLSENTIPCEPTMIDDGKQCQEDRWFEKRMGSVLSSLRFSWLLHIYAFMSYVPECRLRVKLCTPFDGIDFSSWVSFA